MTTAQYKIEKIVHGGYGLSRDENGKVTLIRGAAEGETVSAKIVYTEKNLARGVVSQVSHPSLGRITPPCPSYKRCGGCNFQHLSYPAQLQAKEDILKDLLLRSELPLLRESARTHLVSPLPSPLDLHYRQRIRLQVDENEVVGFYKYRSHTCIPIKACLLAHPLLNQCLDDCNGSRLFTALCSHTASVEFLLNPAAKNVIILFHYKRKPRPADISNAQSLARDISSIHAVYFSGDDFAMAGPYKHPDQEQRDTMLSLTLPAFPPYTKKQHTLSWEVSGFCQVNLKQNEQLIATVLDFCDLKATDTVLDLFCGMGNFAIPLADTAQTVTGIEGQGASIRSARHNSRLAKQENTQFIKSPIHNSCKTLCKENLSFSCIVLDPPRQGIPDMAQNLSALCEDRLIYVSCDPATLCRDLAQLLTSGFIIEKLQPVDMFPQTHHIETVCLLKKA